MATEWKWQRGGAAKIARSLEASEFRDLPGALLIATDPRSRVKSPEEFIKYVASHSCRTIHSRAEVDSGVEPSDRRPMELEFFRQLGDAGVIHLSINGRDENNKFGDMARTEFRQMLDNMGIKSCVRGKEIVFDEREVASIYMRIRDQPDLRARKKFIKDILPPEEKKQQSRS